MRFVAYGLLAWILVHFIEGITKKMKNCAPKLQINIFKKSFVQNLPFVFPSVIIEIEETDVGVTIIFSAFLRGLSIECGYLCVRFEMKRMTQRQHRSCVGNSSYAKFLVGARYALIQQAV